MSSRTIGFWAAVTLSLLSLVALLVSVTTLPRSGPSCTFETCVTYPYTDIAAYFPRDYYWMVPATLLLVPFLIVMAWISENARAELKALSLAGLAFAAMAVSILATTYFIQLTVIQTSVERGELEALSLISQYNPHGVFIALESIGYLVMSVSLLLTAPAIPGKGALVSAVRLTFLAAFILSATFLVALVAIYGTDLEYRFEIAVISINWLALIIGGGFMSFLLRSSAAR